jgi:site-specific recombinase XerD
VKGVRRLGVRLGDWLTADRGRRLLRQNDLMTVRERRDHAMLAVLIGCGLRRGELLAQARIAPATRGALGHCGSRRQRWARPHGSGADVD